MSDNCVKNKKIGDSGRVKPDPEQRRRIAEATIELISNDLNAMSCISKTGMLKFTQALLDLQAEACGDLQAAVDAVILLPCRQTVSNKICKCAVKKREKLVKILQAAIERGELSYSCDFWKDSKNQRDFIAVHTYYFESAESMSGKQ